jgi:nitrous oxidase accessory protein
MKRSASVLVLVLLLSVVFVSFRQVAVVEAESDMIVVPDDYPTIVDAVSNANSGDTILLRAGTYEGPINQTVTVDKTLSIVGEGRENTILKMYPAYNVSWILTACFFDYSDAITFNAEACKLANITVVISNPGGFISAIGNHTQITGTNITTGPSTGVDLNGSHCRIADNVMGGRIQLNGSFNEVAGNSFSYIWVEGDSNVIEDNVCGSVSLDYSNDNTVSGNTITSTTRSYSGISLSHSHNNLASGNYVAGFSSDVRLWFSSDNTFTENVIADSLSGTISVGGSYGNTFFLNNFVDNRWDWIAYVRDQYTDRNYRDAYPNMTLSTNSWDNGTVGNYWCNRTFTDADGDGIGDSPFVINENNQDNYPLMTRADIATILEFPRWAPLLVMVVVVLVVAVMYRRKMAARSHGRWSQ